MYGLKELKPAIKIKENAVECPVKGCSIKVEKTPIIYERAKISMPCS